MRRHSPQCSLFSNGLSQPCDVEVLEVAKTAVNDFETTRGRLAAEIGSLNECGAKPAARTVPRDSEAVDAAADNKDIERLIGEQAEIAL